MVAKTKEEYKSLFLLWAKMEYGAAGIVEEFHKAKLSGIKQVDPALRAMEEALVDLVRESRENKDLYSELYYALSTLSYGSKGILQIAINDEEKHQINADTQSKHLLEDARRRRADQNKNSSSLVYNPEGIARKASGTLSVEPEDMKTGVDYKKLMEPGPDVEGIRTPMPYGRGVTDIPASIEATEIRTDATTEKPTEWPTSPIEDWYAIKTKDIYLVRLAYTNAIPDATYARDKSEVCIGVISDGVTYILNPHIERFVELKDFYFRPELGLSLQPIDFDKINKDEFIHHTDLSPDRTVIGKHHAGGPVCLELTRNRIDSIMYFIESASTKGTIAQGVRNTLYDILDKLNARQPITEAEHTILESYSNIAHDEYNLISERERRRITINKGTLTKSKDGSNVDSNLYENLVRTINRLLGSSYTYDEIQDLKLFNSILTVDDMISPAELLEIATTLSRVKDNVQQDEWENEVERRKAARETLA